MSGNSEKIEMGSILTYINKKHPLLSAIEKRLDEDGQQDLKAFLSLAENYAPFMQSGVAEYLNSSSGEMNKTDALLRQRDLEEIKGYIKSFMSKGYEKDEIAPIILGMANFKYLKEDILRIFEVENYD